MVAEGSSPPAAAIEQGARKKRPLGWKARLRHFKDSILLNVHVAILFLDFLGSLVTGRKSELEHSLEHIYGPDK